MKNKQFLFSFYTVAGQKLDVCTRAASAGDHKMEISVSWK